MESEQAVARVVPRRSFRRSQPAVAAFIETEVSSRRGRRVATDLANQLFASYHRYRKSVPVVRDSDLRAAADAWKGDAKDPVHGWRYALPIPLPEPEQTEVSKVLGAIVAALEPRLRLV
mgnify:CR=1 FL=1